MRAPRVRNAPNAPNEIAGEGSNQSKSIESINCSLLNYASNGVLVEAILFECKAWRRRNKWLPATLRAGRTRPDQCQPWLAQLFGGSAIFEIVTFCFDRHIIRCAIEQGTTLALSTS